MQHVLNEKTGEKSKLKNKMGRMSLWRIIQNLEQGYDKNNAPAPNISMP